MESLLKQPVRFALVRNLDLPSSYDVKRCGLQLRVTRPDGSLLLSETCWGSREASWLVGDGAFSILPVDLTIVVVRGEKVHKTLHSPKDLIEEGATSSLSHPARCSHASSGPDEVVFNDTLDRLLPLMNSTTKDLVQARLPNNVVLFATDHFGRLYASHSTVVRVLQFWGKELPVTLLTSEDNEKTIINKFIAGIAPSKFNLLVDIARKVVDNRRKLGVAKDAASRLLAAKVKESEKLRTERETRHRKRSLETRQDELITSLKACNNSIEKLEGNLHSTVQVYHRCNATEARVRDANEVRNLLVESLREAQIWRRSMQRLMARRLVLAKNVLKIYWLSPNLTSLSIRDMSLDSTSDDDRAVALGHLAHLVSLLATIFDITLRYSAFTYGSRSFVMDDAYFAPFMGDSWPAHSQQRLQSLSDAAAMTSSSGLYPLFAVGLERGAKPKVEMGLNLLLNSVRQVTEVLRSKLVVSLEKVPQVTLSPSGSKPVSPLIETMCRFKLVLAELRVTPPLEVKITTT